MATTTNKSKEDPMEKITKMINDAVEGALSTRDRKEVESKDPWARIEGIIDRAVGKHFEAFAQGLEEGGGSSTSSEKGGKRAGKDEGDNDNPLSLFG